MDTTEGDCSMTIEDFDSLFASMARPYTVYISSTAICICCFFPATNTIALPLAAVLAGGTAYLRTRDKETAAKVSINQANSSPPPVGPAAPPVAPVSSG